MRIGGFQKLTLLDYPDHLAALVFTIGCDLRCPYCHNASLVVPSSSVEMVEPRTILDYLHKRQGVLEGVVISGGEPLMQSDLSDFIRKIKALGYLVKLDTNGSYPLKLKELMDLQLVDYVAVDIKQSKKNYGKAIGLDGSTIVERIDQTISILENSTISHEYRTTLVQGIHTYQDLDDICQHFQFLGRISGNDTCSHRCFDSFKMSRMRHNHTFDIFDDAAAGMDNDAIWRLFK